MKHPSVTNTYELHNNSTIGSLTQIIGNRAVNELRAGYADSWDRREVRFGFNLSIVFSTRNKQ